jgi:hypothetical protein
MENPTRKKMSTVSKLRFMQKATKEVPDTATVSNPEVTPESSERWALEIIDSSSSIEASTEKRLLSTINVVARRSYGGFNPYVEQTMASMEKQKKRNRKVASEIE